MKEIKRYPKARLAQAMVLALTGSVGVAHSFEIEEVVVTAQKRAQSLQDVPVSVSALGSSDLEGLKLRATTEIAAQVPNMQTQTPFGDSFPMISMRGISMSDFSPTQSSPVAVYVDEIYKGNPAIQGVQLFDVERVEVLRGPQGTLYGKNTTGGAVNFITKTPTHEDESYLTLGVGSYSRTEAQGAFQTSLVDDVLAVRVAGTWTEVDGYNENKLAGGDDLNSIDEWGARIAFAYTPSDDFEAILRLSASKSTPTSAGIYTDNYNSSGLYPAGGLPVDRETDRATLGAGSALDSHEFRSDRNAEREVETQALSLTINYDLSETLSLTSITSYDDGEFFAPEDADGMPLDFLHVDYAADATQWAEDIRITSDFDGRFNFIAGLYWAQEEIEASNRIDFTHDVAVLFDLDNPLNGGNGDGLVGFAECDPFGAGLCVTQYNEFDQNKTSKAAYLHSTYDLTDSVRLTLGLRYSEEEAELRNFNALLGGVDLNASDTVTSITQDMLLVDDFVDREWSGKLGLDYTTEDGSLIYASYSKGFRSGAFNGQGYYFPKDVSQVDPETLNSYEVGLKTQLFDNSLQFNAAAFYYDYSDQQVLDVDAATLSQFLVNIDSSTIQGIELELTARPTEALTLRAGLGWIDTEVDEGLLTSINEDLKGNELPAAPELNFNLSADYEWVVGSAGSLLLHVDTNWSDDHYHNVNNSVGQDDYWLTNGRVSFEAADDSYTVAVWVKNIEDKTYKTYSIDLQALGWDYNHLGAPRTVGVEATFRF
ncbi:MAG: TonB-dependent receptor [Cellvibrionaceae bacterium]|nr:TonB-dependent receptor [Cellvibrionaceae bacterium]|tara:strand:+ start:5550 stop:7850 length:2301 start_codon:yes stop_codon:yes gene_type:complete